MFVVTGEGVIAIESVNTQHSMGLLQAIGEVTGQPVKFMLHSHNHWDHASGRLHNFA
jgi:glyoxylase-like metal-dependent hydrolase (beta-lactamase superfamily II)